MQNLVKIWLALALSFAVTQFASQKIEVESKERTPFMIPPKNIEHFSFGYRDSIADSFWVRTIQNFEYCGAEGDSSQIISEAPRWDADSSLEKPQKQARCQKGWGFHMLNEITDLSPKFETIYTMAAPGLSIVVDDREGAEIIFDKGIEAFPDNWQIPYMAAYHALFETRKFEKAAQLLYKVGDLGGPEWVYFLATKVYSRIGQAELGLAVITQYIKNFEPDKIPEHAKKRLAEVQAMLLSARAQQ